MAGILDNKTRIMDVIVTDVGRQQLASGKLQAKFASFTDMHTYYESDPVSGSTDATNRIYFEATSRPQDIITFETDDSGQLFPFTYNNVALRGSNLANISTTDTTFGREIPALTGSVFASQAVEVISRITEHFKEQRLIGTQDPLFENVAFTLSTESITFRVDNNTFANGELPTVNVNSAEPFFLDKRLSHIPNYSFLPPVVVDKFGNKVPLGQYSNPNQTSNLSYDEIMSSLVSKQASSVSFTKTSSDNNILMQFFETTAGEFKKLDVIDFGSFVTNDPDRPGKHVFFVGKVFVDDFDSPTFINLYTVVLD